MKKFPHDGSKSLEDLKYENIVSLIPSDTEGIKFSEESISQDIEEEEEEIDDSKFINSGEFEKKIEEIFGKLANYLDKNKMSIPMIFKDKIVKEEAYLGEKVNAISLQDFINELTKMGIQIDKIGLFCLFAILKINDQTEAVSYDKLNEILKNFGVIQKENNIIDEFFMKLGKFLVDNNMKLMDLLKDYVVSTTIKGENLEAIKLHDFIKILLEKNIIRTSNIDNVILNLFCNENNEFVIFPQLKANLEYFYNKSQKKSQGSKESKSNQSKKQNKLDDNILNDIPNVDSKIFNETLNEEKEAKNKDILIEKVDVKKESNMDQYDFIMEESNEESSRKNSNKKAKFNRQNSG